eukprot:13943251-Heterocapsa_arctica.AAC.1
MVAEVRQDAVPEELVLRHRQNNDDLQLRSDVRDLGHMNAVVLVHVADQVLQHAPFQPFPSLVKVNVLARSSFLAKVNVLALSSFLAKVNVLALSFSLAEIDVRAPDLHATDQLLHLPLLLLVASPLNLSILAPLVITD